MIFPFNVKKFLAFIIVVSVLGGCKTSPVADEDGNNEAVTSTATSKSEPVNSALTASDPETLFLGKFNIFPRETNGWDESGWSIISPSEDTRLIYVSDSTGDDATGEFVQPNTVTDIYNPASIKAFKTIEAAMTNVREGYPDWVLLKKGDVWDLPKMINARSGRSSVERSVISSYGVSAQRPTLKSTDKYGFRIWSDVNFVAIVGVSLYAEQRDPNSSEFLGWGNVPNQTGIYLYQSPGETKRSILLEDNEINFFSGGISMTGSGHIIDTVVRRNIIRNSYSESSHSQGMYAVRASVLLEENIFDHNGWYIQQPDNSNNNSEGGQATMFNHNTYFSDSYDTISRRNIFLRPSSMHQKWTANSPSDSDADQIKSINLLMSDNLCVGGEIGISAGGNTDYGTGPRWENINIIDNVLLAIGRDQPTNRTLGWYIDVDDWNGGDVCGNYLLHNQNQNVNNLNGINVSGHSTDVNLAKNIIFGLLKSNSTGNGAINVSSAPKENIRVYGNTIQLVNSEMRVITADYLSVSEYTDNKYYSDADPEMWFGSENEDYNFADWTMLSGDTNSTAKEEPFVDASRTFSSYLISIGLSGSIDDFMEQASQQSRANWNREFSATVINEYIRSGYGEERCGQQGESYFTVGD
jgi:hypothetical protein